MKRSLGMIGAVAASVLMPAMTMAQSYPQEDVRIVVPWGAGGGVDTIVRKLVSIAEPEFPKSIYVENLEGGISAVGVGQVMSARPDGYNIAALTYDSIISVPWRGLVPDYDLDRLKIVARVTSEPNALMVLESSKYQTFEELIAAAKADPRSIKVSVDGMGSMPHLSLLQLEGETGAKFRPVAYPNGSAGQKEALLSGEVDASVSSLGDFAPLLHENTVKGLVEFSGSPNPTFSQVPISADVGLDMETGSFLLFAVPAGTPDEAVAKLETVIHAAYDSDAFQSWAGNAGVSPSWLGTDEVSAWVDDVQTSITGQLDTLVEQGVIKK